MILVALIVQNMRTSLVLDTVAKLVGDVLIFIFICWLATSSVSSLGLGISVDFILDRPSDVAPVPCSLPLHVVESLCSSHLSPSGSPSHISRWNQKTTSLNCVDTNPGRLECFLSSFHRRFSLSQRQLLAHCNCTSIVNPSWALPDGGIWCWWSTQPRKGWVAVSGATLKLWLRVSIFLSLPNSRLFCLG